jgi:hypothetical protein
MVKSELPLVVSEPQRASRRRGDDRCQAFREDHSVTARIAAEEFPHLDLQVDRYAGPWQIRDGTPVATMHLRGDVGTDRTGSVRVGCGNSHCNDGLVELDLIKVEAGYARKETVDLHATSF